MTIHFYSKPNCPLCDRLEEMIEPYVEGKFDVEHRNILLEKSWYDAYWDRIPVVAFGERVLLEGRPEENDVVTAFSHLSAILPHHGKGQHPAG